MTNITLSQVPADLPPVEVTLFEDRAHVVRRVLQGELGALVERVAKVLMVLLGRQDILENSMVILLLTHAY